MPFDLLTVLPTRLDIEVNGFNGGVLSGVPSAYHWYTERYGVKWPCGYDLNISSQGENFIQVDVDTPGCQPEDVYKRQPIKERAVIVCLWMFRVTLLTRPGDGW